VFRQFKKQKDNMATVPPSQSILFELLRSFTTLARTLNLSHAVKELKSTRQTVRRHILQLEELRGEPLFELIDRQYRLTPAGKAALPEAEELLARGTAWMLNQSAHKDGLFVAKYTDNPEFDYFLQQHPVSEIWRSGSTVMQQIVACWAEAGGQVEHPAFQAIRKHLLVYRQGEADGFWYCAEVGEESSFSSWFGWVAAKSSVGRALERLPGGDSIASLLSQPFKDIASTHGLRLDHVHTQIPRGPEFEGRHPISFQRLMMGLSFPDGSFALGSYVERTYDLMIEGLDPEKIMTMPEDLLMNVHEDRPKVQSIPF
jgi:hypothetical protein